MKLFASPRFRKRLRWLGGVLVVAAGVTVLVMLLPGRNDPIEGPTSLGGYAPPKPEKRVRRSNRQLVGPLQVAEKFITTAVMRKNIAESWDVTSPAFPGKSEYSKAEWAEGDIPVVPFPVEKARWRLDYSFENEVGLAVALFPPKDSEVEATVFNVDLRAYGRGQNRRWLVENYGPAGTNSIVDTRTPVRAGGIPDLGPAGDVGESRLASSWIFVPIGILGLALLVPLVLGIGYVIRVRRAERDFARPA